LSQAAAILPIKKPAEVKVIMSLAEEKLLDLMAKLIVDATLNQLSEYEKSN